MSEHEMVRRDKILKSAISLGKKELGSCLNNFCTKKENKVNCEIYLIKCLKDNVREKDFLGLLSQLIVRYALKKEEYKDIDEKNALSITKSALARFNKSDPSGEVGELILFALLESERNAPQLLNKMSLKTDGNFPVFGLDGIHMGIWNDEIRLYYGESKFYTSHTDAITKAVKDLKAFHDNPKEESFEIELISNNIDILKFGKHSEEIKSILNPYTNDKSNLRKVYAVFIGFNWDSIKKIEFHTINENIQKILEDILKENSTKILNHCTRKVTESKIENLFEFFFIAFKDVEKFRSDFRKVIS